MTFSSETVSIFSGFGFFDERIGHARVRTLDDLLDERGVPLVRDHRKPFGNRRTDSAGMIEMVVAVDDVRERLARPQLARLGNHRKRACVVLRRVDEHQMIRELDERAVMGSPCEKPDASRHFFDRHVRRLRRWGRSGCHGRRRRQLAGVGVDRLPGDTHIRCREIVGLRGESGGELQAADVLVIGERRADDDITQVDVVGAGGHPRRQLRRGIDGKRECCARRMSERRRSTRRPRYEHSSVEPPDPAPHAQP